MHNPLWEIEFLFSFYFICFAIHICIWYFIVVFYISFFSSILPEPRICKCDKIREFFLVNSNICFSFLNSSFCPSMRRLNQGFVYVCDRTCVFFFFFIFVLCISYLYFSIIFPLRPCLRRLNPGAAGAHLSSPPLARLQSFLGGNHDSYLLSFSCLLKAISWFSVMSYSVLL